MTTPPTSRRAATPPRAASRAAGQIAARRPAVIGVMLVGLTLGMLTLAGTTPVGIGRPVDEPNKVTLPQRTFSCTGGIAGTTVRSGNVRDGLDVAAKVAGEPVDVVSARTVARGAFAGQQALVGKALAWVPCPEPQARWWFAGAGSAAVTHNTVLTITNPRPGAAVVDLEIYGAEGLVKAPGLKGITVDGGATRVIDLATTAPTVGNVAVSVIASRGLVSVTAVDRFAPGVLGRSVREWLPPQSLPAQDITLAGLPSVPGSAALVLVNPGDSEALADLRIIGGTGTFKPEGLAPVSVPPQSVVTVPITEVLDGSAMAVRITADQPLTGTVRTTRGGDTAFATGVQVLRDSTSFAVPDGFGRLVLSSLKDAGRIQVLGFDRDGRTVLTEQVQVKAGTSAGVKLTAKVRYVRLIADGGDVVAGFSVAGKKGIASAGVAPALRSIRLPAVRPGW